MPAESSKDPISTTRNPQCEQTDRSQRNFATNEQGESLPVYIYKFLLIMY